MDRSEVDTRWNSAAFKMSDHFFPVDTVTETNRKYKPTHPSGRGHGDVCRHPRYAAQQFTVAACDLRPPVEQFIQATKLRETECSAHFVEPIIIPETYLGCA